MRTRAVLAVSLSALLLASLSAYLTAQKPAERPPHGQDKLPGPALSPAEAIQKMKVPDGFSVELVCAEPDLVNPVAMTFDEKGRVWVTESLEYPRRSPGPGKDRVKVIDIGPDGKSSKVTVFAEGLNIPSGIAVGHGGVWVANAPDILFYKIGPDGKAAGKPEVVVSGFGRTDTHELPNSLTWGPDGWLYGWNGVFNYSHVKYRGKEWQFTCAIFRIHPKTREFELFCEGTSNPWGIAIDPEGSLFASACVIDHLWHLVETGYYHRQGGPYPPFTWKIESIVKHKHQKAAYCGIHYFDSDAYPAQYRDRLYMGNIHGGCVNVDTLTRDGSTYRGTSAPDFLTANDQWFMPVVQKTGPDGCLYVLDWYDRYHCYQDANRDPGGIDRRSGRLYRVRYKDAPRAPAFDLATESDEKLLERLQSPNVYFRDAAQRVLTERPSAESGRALEKLALDTSAPRKGRLHALWALVGRGPLEPAFHARLLAHEDATFRAWGVRAAGNQREVGEELRAALRKLAKDPSADVELQVAIAAGKLKGEDPLPLLLEVLAGAGADVLLPRIVWQNLLPLLEKREAQFLAAVQARKSTPNLAAILPRAAEVLLSRRKPDPAVLATLLDLVRDGKEASPTAVRQILAVLAGKIQNGEIEPAQVGPLREKLLPVVTAMLADEAGPHRLDAALLAASFGNARGLELTRAIATRESEPEANRLRALEALLAGRAKGGLDLAATLLDSKAVSATGRGQALGALARLQEDAVAGFVLARYAGLEAELKPRAVELLTQRPAWARELLKAVGDKKVAADAINVNQVRRMLASKDRELAAAVQARWGTVREDRNPEREKVVADMKQFLAKAKGDPVRGKAVFKTVCAQCHKMHGEGVEVGPDVTLNGRNNYDQLLSNVFDPSLVIGVGYQPVAVTTLGGRQLLGLLVEDSPARVVLKVQGGKQEVIPRGQIEEKSLSKTSMMPEALEKQIKPQEIADLFAYITLDRPPEDPAARRIPGAPSFR